MNRRELMASLAAAPAIGAIDIAKISKNDIVVVRCPGRISEEVAERLKRDLGASFPGRKFIILGDGMDMQFVRTE